jgi:hypothetical protein
MWGLLNAVTAPIKSAANQFARNQAAAAYRNAGLNTVRALRRSPVGSPGELAAATRLTLNTPAVQRLVAGSGGLTAIGVSNQTGFTGQLEGALNQAGPAVDRFFGRITPQAIQNFGREQEKKGWGGALEMATPFGFLAAPFIPNTPAKQQTPMQRAQVGQPMVLGGRLGYKSADGSWQPRGDMESENIPQYLPGSPQADKSGYVWDAARQQASGNRPPVATPPAVGPQLSPEERAYNAERSRIAQLTEQNPEFQNIGQLRNDLRDQGMAIWAAKYGGPGGLASKVKPGAVGYDAIQRGIGIQSIPSIENRAEFSWNQATQGPTPALPMADAMLNPSHLLVLLAEKGHRP